MIERVETQYCESKYCVRMTEIQGVVVSEPLLPHRGGRGGAALNAKRSKVL